MNLKRLFTFCVSGSLLLVSLTAGAIKLPPPPPSKADLAGVWVGPDEASSMLRLELDKLGRGVLIVRESNPSSTAIYKVALTKIEGHGLSFAISRIEGPRNTQAVSGTSLPYALRLVRHYTFLGKDVPIAALLVREAAMQSGIKAVGNASAKFHARAKR